MHVSWKFRLLEEIKRSLIFYLKFKRCMQSQYFDTTSNKCGKAKIYLAKVFLILNEILIQLFQIKKQKRK